MDRLQHEIMHAGLVAAGALGLAYIWQTQLGGALEPSLPYFIFLTAGVFVYDRVIHAIIGK